MVLVIVESIPFTKTGTDFPSDVLVVACVRHSDTDFLDVGRGGLTSDCQIGGVAGFEPDAVRVEHAARQVDVRPIEILYDIISPRIISHAVRLVTRERVDPSRAVRRTHLDFDVGREFSDALGVLLKKLLNNKAHIDVIGTWSRRSAYYPVARRCIVGICKLDADALDVSTAA